MYGEIFASALCSSVPRLEGHLSNGVYSDHVTPNQGSCWALGLSSSGETLSAHPTRRDATHLTGDVTRSPQSAKARH